jgi:type IV pilus assembly protein PilV
MTAFRTMRSAQSGVMLLEALIGILIFSLGVLALIGMQAIAVRTATDSRERAEASNFASQLVGEMWVNRANIANYNYVGSGSWPSEMNNWMAELESALPDVANNRPIVSVAAPVLGAIGGNEVIITVRWQTPGRATPHQFVMTAYVN